MLIALEGFGLGDWLDGACIIALGVLGIGSMGFALLLGLFGWVCSLLPDYWIGLLRALLVFSFWVAFAFGGCSRHFGCCRLWSALDTWVCYDCWVVGPVLALVGEVGD